MNLSIENRLKLPFSEKQVRWRPGKISGNTCLALAYIDARDVMHRLDEVFGIDGWGCKYSHITPQGVVCEISCKINGVWITKSNGAGDTQVEAEKGAMSDAFKRAAVLFGIGRYLYYLPSSWCDMENKRIKNPPKLPHWATPEGYISILEAKAGDTNA